MLEVIGLGIESGLVHLFHWTTAYALIYCLDRTGRGLSGGVPPGVLVAPRLLVARKPNRLLNAGFDFVTNLKKITVHLIDPAKGRTMQTWRFRNESLVRIGRSEQNEVVIGDPYASRFHCELRFQNERWELANLGRHGTMVRGERVEAMAINHGTVFQLGPAGPSFRFETVYETRGSDTTSIYPGPQAMGEALKIDEAKIEEQVEKIAETPYFQHLKRFSGDVQEPAMSPDPDQANKDG